MIPLIKRSQTNTAGVTSKDRSSTGPRPDGGGGATTAEETKGWVPVGGIIGYEGALADLPPNWSFCDGTGGTPDMRNLCVIGANDESEIGDTGGAQVSDNHTTALATLGAGNTVLTGPTNHALPLPPYYKLAWIKRMT